MPALITLILVGSVAFRNCSAAHVRGFGRRFLNLASTFLIATDTSPKSMSTGQGETHLWHTVQWSATSPYSSKWRIETPRRVCSSYRNASVRRAVARILFLGL